MATTFPIVTTRGLREGGGRSEAHEEQLMDSLSSEPWVSLGLDEGIYLRS